MSRSVTTSAAFAIAFLAGAASLAPLACATSVMSIDPEGSGGAGGVGGAGTPTTSAAQTTSSAGGAGGSLPPGPCVHKEDCAALADGCNDGNCVNAVCEKTPKNDGASCDDGKTCTVGDVCKGGVCTGQLKSCPSMGQCTLGVCDVATDACAQMPGNDGAPCDDKDPCSASSYCKSGQCLASVPTDCSFLNGPCKVGACDPGVGCTAKPANDGKPCDDGFFCTVNDQCTNGTCSGAPNPCSPNGNPACVVGSCVEATKACTSVPGNNGAACDDGDPCTAGETCGNGSCLNGAPANAGGACDDKDPCTQTSACNANGQCVGGSPVVQCVGGDNCCPAGCSFASDADCAPPTSFNVLSTADVTYQGIDYLVLQVGFNSATSVAANWCYEYQNLCAAFGYKPTGCGQMFTNMANGYGMCKTMYGSDGTSDTLGCNPSGGVASAAQQAGFADASFTNSFGFHYCDANTCQKVMCSGANCNTALSYIDFTDQHGYTLCKK